MRDKIIRFFMVMGFITLFSLCVYALSEPTKEQPKYEVKSDVLNFNYQEMAYPVKSGTVGMNPQKLVDDKPTAPVKRKPGEPQTEENQFLSGLKIGVYLLCDVAFTIVLASICPGLIAAVIIVVLGAYYKGKKEKES